MSALATLPRRTTVHEHPAEGLGLLHDLMAFPEVMPARHRAPAEHRPTLRAQLHAWIRRAAAWGSGPGGAFRAW